jgi:hypothetical protein
MKNDEGKTTMVASKAGDCVCVLYLGGVDLVHATQNLQGGVNVEQHQTRKRPVETKANQLTATAESGTACRRMHRACMTRSVTASFVKLQRQHQPKAHTIVAWRESPVTAGEKANGSSGGNESARNRQCLEDCRGGAAR